MIASWVVLAGLALPAILVSTVLFAKHASKTRQERHKERMQAIQAGIPLPTARLPGPGTITTIGFGVPFAAIAGALIAGTALDFDSSEALPLLAILWSFATFIALAGLATALTLGLMLHRAHARSLSQSLGDSAKPAYDPDLFEPSPRGY